MRIDRYSFGSIVINGKIYTEDVLILPDLVISPWWRKDGHFLCMEDLDKVLKTKPDIIVIGKGHSGAMAVPETLVQDLTSDGIRVIVKDTVEAVGVFNILNHRKKVAALHLTC